MNDLQFRPQTRLSVLLAQASDVAVILRRGPSKQVLMIRWARDTDHFYLGQWFKGRVYECRCDLSPDGEQLIYFAANQREPHFSWTAISRPPCFTALAYWPKGDCWGGGGALTRSGSGPLQVQLNHRKGQGKRIGKLAPGTKVDPFGEHSGWGEDSPIQDHLLQSGGWRQSNAGTECKNSHNAPVWITYEPPLTWSRTNPLAPALILHADLVGIGQRQGPWRVLRHRVTESGELMADIGQSDWADWDRNGDLLYAVDGKLFRRAWGCLNFCVRGFGDWLTASVS